MPKNLTRDHVKAILDSECKAEPYWVKEDHHKQELAKDVAALANADGGVILIGVKTERNLTHFGDEIKKVRPFPQGLVDLDQYHGVLKSWIYPMPQRVEVRWFPSASDLEKGIVAIFIPAQASVYRPFLLSRILYAKGKLVEIVFGYVERHRASVDHMSVQELHALVKDGLRFESLDQRVESIQERLEQLLQQAPRKASPSQPDFSKLLRGRVTEALIDADLGGRRSFGLAAVPTQVVEIPGLFERRDADIVRLLENPPKLREGGFDLQTGSPARIVRGQLRRAVAPKYNILELWRDGTLIFGAARAMKISYAMVGIQWRVGL